MRDSLQSEFIKTRGKPARRGDHSVLQIDEIPFDEGLVTIRFLSEPKEMPVQGVRLRVGSKGRITMSDGSTTPTLSVWHEPTLAPIVTHPAACADGVLGVNNIYRITHRPGFVTEDQWTGNAGMVLLKSSATVRRYGCSDGLGEFASTDLVFEIEWEPKTAQHALVLLTPVPLALHRSSRPCRSPTQSASEIH